MARSDQRGGSGAGAVAGALRTKVELWLLVTFAALAFVIGLAVGIQAASREQPAVVVPGQEPVPVAPPLTEEELEGRLPQDHPSIGSTSERGVPEAGSWTFGGEVR